MFVRGGELKAFLLHHLVSSSHGCHIGWCRHRALPTSQKVLLGSSGVGGELGGYCRVQGRNYKAPKRGSHGGNAAWWLSSLEHYFGWLLTDTIRLKSAVELIFLSVWKHIFVAGGTTFDKCVFNNTDHFCPKVVSLKCLLVGVWDTWSAKCCECSWKQQVGSTWSAVEERCSKCCRHYYSQNSIKRLLFVTSIY